MLAAYPLGLALPHHAEHSNKDPQADSAGLLTMVEEQQQQTSTQRRGAGGGVGRSATNTTITSSTNSNNNHQQPDALASLMASLAASSAPASASSNTNSTAWHQQVMYIVLASEHRVVRDLRFRWLWWLCSVFCIKHRICLACCPYKNISSLLHCVLFWIPCFPDHGSENIVC